MSTSFRRPRSGNPNREIRVRCFARPGTTESIMIPVTSLPARRSRCSASADRAGELPRLKAGGAEVIAGDDARTTGRGRESGFVTADLRQASWTNFAALVLTPGVPLTHPAPHWTVRAAREAGVEVIGDIELFCRERRRHAPDAPFVAITGTNGKSTTTALIAHLMRVAGYDAQMGGNIGTAILSLEPPRHGTRPRHRDVVVPDRSDAEPRSDRRHPAQCQRRPYRSPRHAGDIMPP